MQPAALYSDSSVQSNPKDENFLKKTGYVNLAFIFFLLHASIDIGEYIVLLHHRQAGFLPSGWRTNFLLSHVVAFYFGVLGFIYCYESNQKTQITRAWICLGLNLAVFILRVYYDVQFIDYYPTRYST